MAQSVVPGVHAVVGVAGGGVFHPVESAVVLRVEQRGQLGVARGVIGIVLSLHKAELVVQSIQNRGGVEQQFDGDRRHQQRRQRPPGPQDGRPARLSSLQLPPPGVPDEEGYQPVAAQHQGGGPPIARIGDLAAGPAQQRCQGQSAEVDGDGGRPDARRAGQHPGRAGDQEEKNDKGVPVGEPVGRLEHMPGQIQIVQQ